MAIISNFIKTSLIILIRCYRFLISYSLGPCCRFEPTCSAYALGAIERYGSFKGSCLAFWRLLRCHPWHAGGLDPIP